MKTKDLKKGFHIWGNKGAVWSNKCHIAEDGFSSTTLCGIPMLSNNWARIDNIVEIGCEECIKLYDDKNNPYQMKKSQFSINDGKTYHDGFTLGELWNGWACPYFEHEVCRNIMQEINKLSEETQSGERLLYDDKKDVFIYEVDNEVNDEYRSMCILYNQEVRVVYPLGAYGWVWWDKAWEKEEEPDKVEDLQAEYKRKTQRDYLDDAITDMERLLRAFEDMHRTWMKDSKHELDLNDYLVTLYPFSKSFDEVLTDVALWYADGCSKMVMAKKQLMEDSVEEPEAEYSPSITLGMGFKSEYAEFLDVDKIKLTMSNFTRLNILRAMDQCKAEKHIFSINIDCYDEVEFLTHEDDPTDDFRADVMYYVVYNFGACLYAQSKWDCNCHFESEMFYIDDNMNIETASQRELQLHEKEN